MGVPKYRVIDIPDIYAWDLEIIHDMEIVTTEVFLRHTAKYEDRLAFHKKTKIDMVSLLFYANACDFLTVTGLGTHHIKVLRKAGVRTLLELSYCNAENVHARMYKAGSFRGFPSIRRIQDWIDQAKRIPKCITYR